MSKLTLLLIIAAFFNGLSWIILIPMWQYPDEQSHFAQVQDIAELGNVPKEGPTTSLEIYISEKILATERDGLGNNKFTYHPYYHIDYSNSMDGIFENFVANLPKGTRTSMFKFEATQNPPLYHIMSANFYRLFQRGSLYSRVFAVRFFSLLLYVAVIAFCVNASKSIFDEKYNRLIVPSVIAFTPMLAFSTTGVLPDPLTILLFTIIFILSLKIIKSSISMSLVILLIVINTLGIFTRQQFQIAIPISVVAVLYGVYQRIEKKRIFWISTLALTVTVVLALIKIYKSKIVIPELGQPDASLIFTYEFIKYFKSAIAHYYSQTLPWYWGVYKWLSLTLPHVYYQIINRIIIIAVIGFFVWIAKIIKDQKIQKRDTIVIFLTFSVFIYFAIFVIWDFYFQRIYGYPFGIQGRYFLPLVLPITSLIIFGITNVFQLFLKKYLNFICFVIVFAMIMFNDISLSFIASTYYGSNSIKIVIDQISQYKPQIFKGNVIIYIISLSLLLQVIYLYKLLRKLGENYESIQRNRIK